MAIIRSALFVMAMVCSIASAASLFNPNSCTVTSLVPKNLHGYMKRLRGHQALVREQLREVNAHISEITQHSMSGGVPSLEFRSVEDYFADPKSRQTNAQVSQVLDLLKMQHDLSLLQYKYLSQLVLLFETPQSTDKISEHEIQELWQTVIDELYTPESGTTELLLPRRHILQMEDQQGWDELTKITDYIDDMHSKKIVGLELAAGIPANFLFMLAWNTGLFNEYQAVPPVLLAQFNQAVLNFRTPTAVDRSREAADMYRFGSSPN